ncbi:hypothetical protein R3I94_006193 [Phoxinus phoxinus]
MSYISSLQNWDHLNFKAAHILSVRKEFHTQISYHLDRHSGEKPSNCDQCDLVLWASVSHSDHSSHLQGSPSHNNSPINTGNIPIILQEKDKLPE